MLKYCSGSWENSLAALMPSFCFCLSFLPFTFAFLSFTSFPLPFSNSLFLSVSLPLPSSFPLSLPFLLCLPFSSSYLPFLHLLFEVARGLASFGFHQRCARNCFYLTLFFRNPPGGKLPYPLNRRLAQANVSLIGARAIF